jgi:hypothetical protein
MKRVALFLFWAATWIAFSAGTWAQTAVPPSTGDGSSGSPYQITELGNLVWLHDQAATPVNASTNKTNGKHYKLMNDIAASATASWNDGGTDTNVLEGFNPIGTYGGDPSNMSAVAFCGVFDGSGHTISGLTINRPDGNNVALFGMVGLGGEVKNLGVVGGSMTGDSNVAGIAAINLLGTVSQCWAANTLVGSGSVGGVVGVNHQGTVSQCCGGGSASGEDSVGGLVGLNYQGTVTRSCAGGSAEGTEGRAGALLGESANGTISECYATGAVRGDEYGTDVGGLIGRGNGDTVSNSYWDVSATRQVSSDGGTGKSTGQMELQTTFAGWDFTVVWGISGGYPYLRALPTHTLTYTAGGGGAIDGTASTKTQTANVVGAPVLAYPNPGFHFTKWSDNRTANPRRELIVTANLTVTASFAGGNLETALPPLAGDGLTTDTAYEFTRLGNLVWLRDQVTSGTTSGVYYKMTSDIDASASKNWNDAGTDLSILEGFHPIGGFDGTFDGAGHKITGLFINRVTVDSIGLFSYLNEDGQLRNLTVHNGTMVGCDHVGGLVGTSDGKITGCTATCNVTGRYYVGGLAGVLGKDVVSFPASEKCEVSDCVAAGYVVGYEGAGGLVGLAAEQSVIVRSYAVARVNVVSGSANAMAGGLAGWAGGIISRCYAKGPVTGDDAQCGGLIGANYGLVSYCFASGNVIGTAKGGYPGGTCGGLIGVNGEEGMVTQCHSSGNVTSTWLVGGLIGANDGSLTECYASGTARGNSTVGGLCGSVGGMLSFPHVTRCYASGGASGNTHIGGFGGETDGTEVIEDCRGGGSASGNSFVGSLFGWVPSKGPVNDWAKYYGVTGSMPHPSDDDTTTYSLNLPGADDLTQASTFTGWDFTNTWALEGGRPYLRSLPTCVLTYSSGGHGQVADALTTGTALTQTINAGGAGVAVMALPSPNYKFAYWSDGSRENPRTDAGATENKSLIALFEEARAAAREWPLYR